ncbi:hypothetical protein D9M73_70740 [compost metagenome]|nr:MAG TPA: DnaJ domain protein [Caudoviricetes sp.]
MATNIPDEANPPPTIEEQYSSAIGASNLRVQLDRRSVADMVIAAGMNPHRLGMALRRLAHEWDAVGKPPPPQERNILDMAAKYKRIPGTGLVEVKTHGRDGVEVVEQMSPLEAAQLEAARWHAHELGLLFQRLKTLPEVRAALVAYFQGRATVSWHAPLWFPQERYDEVPHVVSSVLKWWLSPTCEACHGVKKRVVLGTGRTSSKDCSECKGTGERRVPHGMFGRRVVSHMNHCQREAVAGLRGKFKHHA